MPPTTMTFGTLARRSLRYHARAHAGVLLGVMVGAAVLAGALLVGDSVRGSLRQNALDRLGWVDAAMDLTDRYFQRDLEERLARELGLPVRLQYHDAVGVPSSVSRKLKLSKTDLASAFGEIRMVSVLRLPGTAARQDGTARANRVNMVGVRSNFWPQDFRASFARLPAQGAVLNEALAAQLNARVGDRLVLRANKPSALSREMPITPQSDLSVALRVEVAAVVGGSQMGNFSLHASQLAPLNIFLRAEDLEKAAGLENRANLLLVGTATSPKGGPAPYLNEMALRSVIQLEDLELELAPRPDNRIELRSRRIFLAPPITAAARRMSPYAWPLKPNPAVTNATHLLTYLVNQFRCGEQTVPYSMVTAADAPLVPPDLREDEILLNPWLAEALKAAPGSEIELEYFLPESGSRLAERTNRFRVKAVVPLDPPWGDRSLMPEFPGLAKAESTHDWDAGFPLVHKIRDQDEAYWKQYRGTPKAFVRLATGQQLWGNRFGDVTAVRFHLNRGLAESTWQAFTSAPHPREWPNAGARTDADWLSQFAQHLADNIPPASVGFQFEPVRERALAAAAQSQDFGGLFIGFSFFLITAALILVALLFQLGLEQRTTEAGTLRALGYSPRRAGGLFLLEGAALALLGGLLGVAAGTYYARAMLLGLSTLWRDAVGIGHWSFHATPVTYAAGLGASLAVSLMTLWLALRQFIRRPVYLLLAGTVEASVPLPPLPRASGLGHAATLARGLLHARWLCGLALTAALGLVGWAIATGQTANAGVFFGAGALLLVGGLAGASLYLTALERGPTEKITLSLLGLRGCTRRRKRTLSTVAMLACGSFIIVSLGAFRLDEKAQAPQQSSGTGGFALLGVSALPVVKDLNTAAGREFYGLDAADAAGVSVIPGRVREGDDASCLNLNRAQKPRLLGMDPDKLAGRFTFALRPKKYAGTNGWELLKGNGPQPPAGGLSFPSEIPAIGDAASIQWALGKKIGDTLDYVDERGRPFRVRLVGGVANSILQGNLIIAEDKFRLLFPGESGYRFFLFDTPAGKAEAVSARLSRAFEDQGLELTPAPRRLAAFNAVQNTYLGAFQVLGGLGLLLGSAGLAVVVLRNVLERRGELALLLAVGYRPRLLRRLILTEHSVLLLAGLAIGLLSALVAVLPALLSPSQVLPVKSLGMTLAAVLANGLLWTWLATRWALRGKLLDALRNE